MVGLYSSLHQPVCVQLPGKLLKLSGPTGQALDSYNLDVNTVYSMTNSSDGLIFVKRRAKFKLV